MQDKKTFTIALNGKQSDSVNIQDHQLLGLKMPAAWTAATVGFLGSTDNVNFATIYDDNGIEAQAIVDASRAVSLVSNALAIAPWPYIKLRSGTEALEVAQLAGRSIEIVMKA